MDLLLALSSGLALGCIHAFDIDHVVAVTAFASSKPDAKKAVRFGILWGLGHTFTVVMLGLLSIALKFAVSPNIESTAEIAAGVLLIGIGTWAVANVLKNRHVHIHRHAHDGDHHVHFHSHAQTREHFHKHSMFFVGATHGFAGTAAVMVIIPVAFSQSVGAAALFLLLFGIGTTVAMATFAFLIGTLATRTQKFQRWLHGLAGTVSIGVGLMWIAHRL
jgi:sulfite exporter TauE/SafE